MLSLTDEQISDYQEVFLLFDKDEDGLLTNRWKLFVLHFKKFLYLFLISFDYSWHNDTY